MATIIIQWILEVGNKVIEKKLIRKINLNPFHLSNH